MWVICITVNRALEKFDFWIFRQFEHGKPRWWHNHWCWKSGTVTSEFLGLLTPYKSSRAIIEVKKYPWFEKKFRSPGGSELVCKTLQDVRMCFIIRRLVSYLIIHQNCADVLTSLDYSASLLLGTILIAGTCPISIIGEVDTSHTVQSTHSPRDWANSTTKVCKSFHYTHNSLLFRQRGD